MFNGKLQSLGTKKTTSDTAKNNLANPFLNAGLKKSAETLSGNGALKYSTTGNPFVDQFSFIGSYKQPRSFQDIEKDCEILWADSGENCVKFIYYIRLITRKVQLFDGYTTKDTQKGGQLKHEGIMRMIWLHQKAPKVFWKNIGLFVSVGSWQDIIKMLQYDLIHHNWENKVLDWKRFGALILSGLANENTSELLKKYLPQIKANSACKTVEAEADNMIAKWICNLVYGTKEGSSSYKKYRTLKTSGTAHGWQKLISQGKHNLIDFSTIHGRALTLLSRSKFLKNQGLEEKYEQWITKPETEVKYTGFIHELFQKLPTTLSGLSVAERDTINKQFETYLNKGGQYKMEKIIVVRDISNSMGATCTGTTLSCYNIAKILALYFSFYLKDEFSNSYIEFNSKSKLCNWTGNTPLERFYNDNSKFIGKTNFMGVIELFCELKKTGIPQESYPTTIVCLSDGEFNPTQLDKTNVEAALDMLRNSDFSNEYVNNFKIILWNLNSKYYGKNTGKKFETFGIDVPNVYYFGGFSPEVISFLTNEIKNASQIVDESLSQEILEMIKM